LEKVARQSAIGLHIHVTLLYCTYTDTTYPHFSPNPIRRRVINFVTTAPVG